MPPRRIAISIVILGLAILAAGRAVVVRADQNRETIRRALQPDPDPAAPRRVRLHFTGNRLGSLRPCNCSGITGEAADAEATFLKTFRGDPTPLVRFDSGGFVHYDATDTARIRTAFLLQGLSLLHLDAINVTADDLDVGVDTLLEAARRYRLPLISANLHRAGESELLFPPSKILEARDPAGRVVAKIGVIGVSPAVPPVYPTGTEPRFGLPGYPSPSGSRAEDSRRQGGSVAQIGRRYRTSPPREALEREIARIRPECDFLIVLTRLAIPGARNLADGIAGIDAVVAGGETALDPEAGILGTTPVIAPGAQGTGVVELLVAFDDMGAVTGMDGTTRDLSKGWKPDPDILALVHAQMRVESLSSGDGTQGRSDSEQEGESGAFVGALTCRDCHFALYEEWASSRHGAARFEELSARHSAREPLCLGCHTTGFGHAGGFDSVEATPGFKGVQCESCHGPSDRHVAWAYREWRTGSAAARVPPPADPRYQCAACHTPHSDPGYLEPALRRRLETPGTIHALGRPGGLRESDAGR